MTGYEKSSDYGGKPPTWWDAIGAFIVFVIVMAVCALVFGY